MTIGDHLCKARHAASLTQHDVAAAVGISCAEVSRIESNQRVPDPYVWWRAAKLVRLSSEEAVSLYLSVENRGRTLVRFVDVLIDAEEIDLARTVSRCAWLTNRQMYQKRYNGDLYRVLGRLAYARGNFLVASGWFRRMRAAKERGHSKPIQTATALYDYGLALKRLGKWDLAWRELEEARRILIELRAIPLAGYACLALANMFIELRGYRMAKDYYREAIKWLNPDTPSVQYAELGQVIVAIALGHRRSAERPLHDLLQHGVPLVQRLTGHLLGVLLRQRGRPREALEALDRSLQLAANVVDRQVVSTYSERILCLLLLGERHEARKTLELVWPHLGVADHVDYGVLSLAAAHLGRPASVPSHSPGPPLDYEARWEAIVDLTNSVFVSPKSIALDLAGTLELA